MAVYTVYGMPDSGATVSAADRVRFVSDRFALSALLFGPIWLAFHRLWWGLAVYGLVVAALYAGGRELHLPVATFGLVLLLVGIFLGLEGATLQEWALAGRGYRVADLISAASREGAEREFFRRWAEASAPGGAGRSPATPPRGEDGQIIGVFPTAGGMA
jgi:uncharacterized membrane protein YbhN (UPF0104 family)